MRGKRAGKDMVRSAAMAGGFVLALSVAACGGGEKRVESPAAPPVPVTVDTATLAPLAERLEAGGVVKAGTSAVVSSRVMASVLERRVRAGDRVRRGQMLVVLDDRDLSAQTRQTDASATAAEQGVTAARSEAAAAAAEQKLAEAWHTRIATLRGQNSATLQELDEAEARLAGASARLEGARARIEQATAGLAAARAAGDVAATIRSFSVLTAPFDALVTETLIEQGNLATPGQPLLRLDADGAQEVEVRMDEARVPFVHVGDQVEVLLESGSTGQAATPMTATVREVARAVETDERSFIVKVSLPLPAVRTGSFARVRFRGATRQVLTVPSSALRRQGQVATAFTVDGEFARLRYLQTGVVDGDRIEVLAGIEAGERVVISPPAQLTDGARVTVSAASPTGGAR